MRLFDIPIPEVYLESNDFRFFLKWFEASLGRLQYDTENVLDLYDPQRCPEHLLWMLGDTMGYKYDSRLSPAFCRLVLLYFMSMIRYKGSKSGVTLAAEVNLAQFNLQAYAEEKDILNNRLEDTSIPVNSVYVTAHTPEGFIDVVYFSDTKPVDACIEYVRPLGMYCFQHAGVKYDGRTKISIDARLTNIKDSASGEGITRVGHYSREDYARMQKMRDEDTQKVNRSHKREQAWKRNSSYEDIHDGGPTQDAGYRALYSLQMCNGEHITKSLLSKGPIFDLEYGPQDIGLEIPNDNYAHNKTEDWQKWNLRYNLDNDLEVSGTRADADVKTIDWSRTTQTTPQPQEDGGPTFSPVPAVNPIMAAIGDAMNIDKEVYQDFTSDVKQGAEMTIESFDGPDTSGNLIYTVSKIVTCKYGTTSDAETDYVELKEGKDYRIINNNKIRLLSTSEIIPSTSASGKTLRIYYTYSDNTLYTSYNYNYDPEDEHSKPFTIDEVTPRDTSDT